MLPRPLVNPLSYQFGINKIEAYFLKKNKKKKKKKKKTFKNFSVTYCFLWLERTISLEEICINGCM